MAVGKKSCFSFAYVMTKIGILYIGLLIFQQQNLVFCQGNSTVCSSKWTCSECITSGPECVWCQAKDNHLNAEGRCGTMDKMINICPHPDIVNPANTVQQIKNKRLSEPRAPVDDIVQLGPQEVTLNLRPNSPSRFQVKFRQAEDYPVDLYFLMDLSYSMSDDKQKLASLGDLLGKTLGRITSNFRIGFGSFVDKPVAPFVDSSPEKLKEPCKGCVAPYGFINHMPLAKDITRFVNEVNNSSISGNLDTPEGTLDAMMQAIVCKAEIGWRDVSRKILLVATDNGYHMAGDGKLGGIVTPNDELCHLDTNGVYTASTTMDYPSVGQINYQVIKNHINIIFVATASSIPIYSELTQEIVGSYTGQLTTDSGNVVDLIRDNYNKISSIVELKDDAPNNVQVKYFSKCLDDYRSKAETNRCHGLRVGDEVEFDVELQVRSCPPNAIDRKIRFTIYPVGLTESLVVNLEPVCECECQQHKELQSTQCSGVGTLECGMCICPDSHVGQLCECDAQAMAQTQDETPCTVPDSYVLCSGRGTCNCNQCMCYSTPGKQIYGQYCECDDVSCPMHDGLLCGGAERGRCSCGRCECLPGWTGEQCECDTSTKNCESSEGVVCSDKGHCVCGECKCDAEFGGRLCEKALQAREARCLEFKECAHCFVFKGPMEASDCSQCARSPYTFIPVEKAEVVQQNDYKCVFRDDADCNFYFVYDSSREFLDVPSPIRVQRTKECPMQSFRSRLEKWFGEMFQK